MAAETEQKMQTCDLLIRNAYVLTCDEQRSVFIDGAIAIQGTDIEAVGSESELTALYHPKRVMDAGGGLVHPGLMDLHYHVNYHLVGKLVAEVDLSDTDPGPWAAQQYTAMINTLGDEEEYASAMLCGLDMLTSGVTLVMDPGSTFEPDILAQASDALGFRVSLADPWVMDTKGPQITDVKRANVERKAALAGLGGQLWRNQDPNSRVRAHISVYGMGNDSDELRLPAKKVADEAGVTFNMHQSQSIDDAEFDDWSTGNTPWFIIRRLGSSVRIVCLCT